MRRLGRALALLTLFVSACAVPLEGADDPAIGEESDEIGQRAFGTLQKIEVQKGVGEGDRRNRSGRISLRSPITLLIRPGGVDRDDRRKGADEDAPKDEGPQELTGLPQKDPGSIRRKGLSQECQSFKSLPERLVEIGGHPFGK